MLHEDDKSYVNGSVLTLKNSWFDASPEDEADWVTAPINIAFVDGEFIAFLQDGKSMNDQGYASINKEDLPRFVQWLLDEDIIHIEVENLSVELSY